MVPGVGFEPTSPHLQCGAFTRLASQAVRFGLLAEAAKRRRLARTAGIEPAPPEWRSGTLPLSHVRVRIGAPPRIRTSRRPTCWFHRRRFYRPVAGGGRLPECAAAAHAACARVSVFTRALSQRYFRKSE